MSRLILLSGACSLLILISGCFSEKREAAATLGRREITPYIAPPTFDDQESAVLKQWHTDQTVLFTKLNQFSMKSSRALDTRNREAIKFNIAQSINLGDDEETAKATERFRLLRAGYPEGHSIFELVNPKENK